MRREVRQKNLVLSILDMFVWMSGFYNPLAHTYFNMFVDEWTSANDSPIKCIKISFYKSVILFSIN